MALKIIKALKAHPSVFPTEIQHTREAALIMILKEPTNSMTIDKLVFITKAAN